MPRHVLLAVTPQVAHIAPGEEISLSLTVRNVSADAGRYRLHVTGLREEWYCFANAEMAFAPHEEGLAQLLLHPPRDDGTLAGRYPFRVYVTADADGERRTSAVVELVIGTSEPFGLTVDPHEATGRAATFQVTLSNNMDFPASLTLGVYCEANGLQVSADPAGPVTVPAGGTAVVNVHVTPNARGDGVPVRVHELGIWAAPPGREGDRSPRLTQRVRFTPVSTRPRLFGWIRR